MGNEVVVTYSNSESNILLLQDYIEATSLEITYDCAY